MYLALCKIPLIFQPHTEHLSWMWQHKLQKAIKVQIKMGEIRLQSCISGISCEFIFLGTFRLLINLTSCNVNGLLLSEWRSVRYVSVHLNSIYWHISDSMLAFEFHIGNSVSLFLKKCWNNDILCLQHVTADSCLFKNDI